MSRAWEFLDLSVVFSRTPFHPSQAWIPSSSTQSPRHGGITHVEASLKQKPTLLCIPRDTPWCVGRKKSKKSGRLIGPEQHPPHHAYTLATWAASGLSLIQDFYPCGKSTAAASLHRCPRLSRSYLHPSQTHRNVRWRVPGIFPHQPRPGYSDRTLYNWRT